MSADGTAIGGRVCHRLLRTPFIIEWGFFIVLDSQLTI